ncbi:hypothetical protein P4594_27650 [Priestia megaterium]|uniref:PIN domain-containing protein n=1 Tax=Priestia megaterium TaxID=1404 RepID=UPI002E24B956|nr:hypothetical protein [Priestia megaterium]
MSAIGTKIVSTIIGEQIKKLTLKWEETRKIKFIKTTISDFNRKFDNTELDTYAFQQVMLEQDIIETVYTTIFLPHTVQSGSLESFKKKISQITLAKVNGIYIQNKRNQIHNEVIFFDYFEELVNLLCKIKNEIIPWKDALKIGIVTEEIRENHADTQRKIEEHFEKLREDNIFADDKINEIKKMVNLYKLYDAENELSEVLESQHLLSIPQREEILYEKAKIYMYNRSTENMHVELEKVKSKIKRINPNSSFISEIDYHIACEKKNRKLLDESLISFQEHRYSNEKLILKKVNFEINIENFDEAFNLLTSNGEMKIELQEHHEAHFHFGNILLRKGLLKEALKEFIEAFQIHNCLPYKYNTLVVRYHILLNEYKKLEVKSKKITEPAQLLLKDLNEIVYAVKYFPYESRAVYWLIVVSLTTVLDEKKALKLLDNIDSELKANSDMKNLIADIYFHNNLYEEAKEALLEISNHNVQYAINLFTIFSTKEDWQSIVDKYNSFIEPGITSDPIMRTFYLKARYKLFGYLEIIKFLVPLVEENPNNEIVLGECLNIVLENHDISKYELIIKLIKNNKSSISSSILGSIARLLLKFKKSNEVKELLETRIEHDEQLLQIYILSLGEIKETSENATSVYERIKYLYSKGVRFKFLLEFKVELEILFNNWRKAIETLIEYKKIHGLTNYYAYYMIVAMLERHEVENLEEEVDYLLASGLSYNYFLVANLKAKQEKWDEACYIAIQALYNSYENLEENVIKNYFSFFMSNLEKNQDVVFKRAANNTVVILEKGHYVRNIAIHSNEGIVIKPGEQKFNCENYNRNDAISLILKSNAEVGEELDLQDGRYKVREILNLYTYLFRFCSQKIQAEYKNTEEFYFIESSSSEDLVEKLKDNLAIFNENRNKQIEMYNFGVQTGMPISYLSGNSILGYGEIIISLLNHKTQHFYAGELSIYENKEYVLSLSSLIMLNHFNMSNKLAQIVEKCYVSPKLIKSIEVAIKESQISSELQKGIVTLNEEGEIAGYTYSDEEKSKMKKFWTSLLMTATNLSRTEVLIEDRDIYDYIGEFVLEADIESIELSERSNRVLVCDDLFIRKIHKGITNSSNTTNFIGFLVSEALLEPDELLDLLIRLVESRYLYPINSNLILAYLDSMFSVYKGSEELKVQFGKLKKVFKYILDEETKVFYNDIYMDFLKPIMEEGLTSLVYELVREPLKLKPLSELRQEAKQKIFKEFNVDSTSIDK